MERFIQLHVLTCYPPSNLNRDESGRPKAALFGGTPRLRVSSQSLKRAWRTSDIFGEALGNFKGIRTKTIGRDILKTMIEKGVTEKNATDWIQSIVKVFGKNRKADSKKPQQELDIEQMANISPEEMKAISTLVQSCIELGQAPTDEQLKLLKKENSGADIAMFGRMLAHAQDYNIEAAVQVSHALTVHESEADEDFFTAVDDLNKGDSGAGHLGVTEFGAGVFYLYICINQELLLENLSNNKELAKKSIGALVECIAKVSPTGMQNSFASRAYASFILAEKGTQQPRSLSVAFLNSNRNEQKDKGVIQASINALMETQEKMERAYGKCADSTIVMDVENGKGSLQAIIDFTKGEDQ